MINQAEIYARHQRTCRKLSMVALFTFPNTLIAIQMRYSYWGQVRAAYEVPIFHLLPMLLFLYWWLSSRERRWGE
ncbi:MAG: hypothetical protein H6641_09260 [Caldilineaceae bacterium]|nr:hypothetical protein [Caldilineaceae bacterium]